MRTISRAVARFSSTLLPLVLSAGMALAESPAQVDIHDPAMAEQDGHYYLYSTGPGITFYSSADLQHWRLAGRVFPGDPAWAKDIVEKFSGHIWAPDIVRHDGKYYLYYSVSGFGKNDSAIGVTVNTTLDPNAKDYRWQDLGIVVRSHTGRDLWNAIDPGVIADEHGTPWMAFGSFWSGIKLVKLDASWTKLAEPQEWYAIARRARPWATDDSEAGPGEIEGPFLIKKGDYYYLFVSTGLCCRGQNSTYRIAYGRSKTITGPYLDKQGRDMAKGGGTALLPENSRWAGWGGNSVYSFGGKDFVVMHAYENADNQFHRLKLIELTWDDAQWPVADAKAIDAFRGWLVK